MSIRTNHLGQPLIREYGCHICQAYHRAELDPDLYEDHLYHQSKHGSSDRLATAEEIQMLELAERMRCAAPGGIHVHAMER